MERTAIAVAAALAALSLTACERGAGDGTVGQKLDRAVEKTQQSLADAGEKTREALRESAPKVERKLSAAGDRIEAATQKTVDTTREALHDEPATASGPAHAGAPEARTAKPAGTSSDFLITASIKADLVKDPDLSALKIDVDTKDGVVTLNGLASDESGKQRAERIALGVKGVREVRNYLTVKRG